MNTPYSIAAKGAAARKAAKAVGMTALNNRQGGFALGYYQHGNHQFCAIPEHTKLSPEQVIEKCNEYRKEFNLLIVDIDTAFAEEANKIRMEAEAKRVAKRVGLSVKYFRNLGFNLRDVLGGTRRTAAKPGCWSGHLVSLINDRYLMDTTLDQVDGGEPCVIDLRETEWFKPERPYAPGPWTGILDMLEVEIRYVQFRRQNGWKYAEDFRPSRRKAEVVDLIEQSKEIFECASFSVG